MSWVISGYLILAGLSLLVGTLMLLLSYETARFVRNRLAKPAPRETTPRVQLFIPCKGVEESFDQMVAGVRALDYPNYRVTFVVEAEADPAHGRLMELLRDAPAGYEVVVAGATQDCGQKVHNLRAATANIPTDVEVVAFADSDIIMEPDWMRWLVARLDRKGVGATSGFMWMAPPAGQWLSRLLAALYADLAAAFGNHDWNVIWGGSWAMRRELFDRLDIRGRWQGTVADDTSVVPAIREAGLKVYFEPGCLTAVPVKVPSWTALVAFVRRHLVVTRVHIPNVWLSILFMGLALHGIFWLGVVLFVWGLLAGKPCGCVLVALILLHGVHTLRAWVRHGGVPSRLSRWRRRLQRVARFDLLAHPVIGLIGLTLVAYSAFGRVVTWRKFHYRVVGPNRTEIVRRGD